MICLDIKEKTKTKASPKKKGRNPWSDSEDGGSDSSGSDFGGDSEKVVPARSTARRSAGTS